MNKLGQEINPVAFVMGIAGAIIAFILAGRMETSLLYKLFTTLLTGVACYFFSSFLADN